MKIKFIKLNKESFDTYKTWFSDKELNTQLGPMDQETWATWQSYQKEEKSEELGAYLKQELVAVIDISLPTVDYPAYCIAAIATHPQKKRLGIATAVLKQLLQSDNFTKSKTWISHVNPKNVAAINFFEKHGWKQSVIENGMITYAFVRQT